MAQILTPTIFKNGSVIEVETWRTQEALASHLSQFSYSVPFAASRVAAFCLAGEE